MEMNHSLSAYAQVTCKILEMFWAHPDMKKSLALVASETRAAFRKKRGDASVHMYSFNKAAVVFLDIQERLNNDWFVLTALLSLVHQPHILASFNFFLFFFFIFPFFFLKKEATKSLTSFPHLLLRDEDHLPSILYITPLHPHCTSSVLFLTAVPIALPHVHIHTQPKHTETQNIIQRERKGSVLWKAVLHEELHRFWELIITLETKLTMAVAGWSGSISANKWLTLSVVLPCFLATKPKNLERRRQKY